MRSNGQPRGHRGKKMIFELIFENCWNKPPLFFWFETILNVRPQHPRNGLGQPISKITFLKSLDQMEKNELYFGFVVNKKSKSIFKGGVRIGYLHTLSYKIPQFDIFLKKSQRRNWKKQRKVNKSHLDAELILKLSSFNED